MQDQSQELDRLRTEVASLKLELATLTSVIRELQHHQSGPRLSLPAKALSPPDVRRPSLVPAAVVVMMAAGLLSWQVMQGPRADRLHALVAPAPAVATAKPDDRTAGGSAHAAPSPKISLPEGENGGLTPKVYKGALSVRADTPGAKVFVNRRNVGTAPVRVDNLRAGAHLVWVESDGYRRWSRVVTVPAETVTRVSADLEPEESVEER